MGEAVFSKARLIVRLGNRAAHDNRPHPPHRGDVPSMPPAPATVPVPAQSQCNRGQNRGRAAVTDLRRSVHDGCVGSSPARGAALRILPPTISRAGFDHRLDGVAKRCPYRVRVAVGYLYLRPRLQRQAIWPRDHAPEPESAETQSCVDSFLYGSAAIIHQ